MTGERFLLDTFFIQALLNKGDAYHQQALAFFPRVRDADEVWVTEAVLIEVGNALSSINRLLAANFIKQSYQTANIRVVPVDTGLLTAALNLYESRPDKAWGLTDCISFIVMENDKLTDAVTADRHFLQAGYRPLLAEYAQSTGPQGHRATGPQGHRATGPQGHRATGPQGHRAGRPNSVCCENKNTGRNIKRTTR